MSTTLASKVIPNARIEAYKHPHVDAPPRGFRGGPVLSDSELDRYLRHTRSRKPVDSFDENAVFSTTLTGHYSYGGGIFPHFGHVMAEMIHRILPVQELEANPRWLFVTREGHPISFDKLAPWLQELYQFLGVAFDRATIINANVEVGSLLIVQAGSDLGGGPIDTYLDLLDATLTPRLEASVGAVMRPSRIYVSRAGLNLQGSFLGERYLEGLLAEEGFSIVQPENHRILDQLDFYRKADVVIFPEGSACHGTELLGRNALGKCVFLPRRKAYLRLFENVLKPRSREYLVMPDNIYLGTVSRRPDGQPSEDWGVTLLDFRRLLKELRKSGIARLAAADVAAYHEAAEADLARYLQQKAKQGRLDDLELVKSLLSAFAEARAA